MRISKTLSLICAAAFCVSFIARADDNAAQAAARAALMQKMQELDSQSNSPAAAVTAPDNQSPVSAPAETQAAPAAPEMATPQPATEPAPASEDTAPQMTPAAPATDEMATPTTPAPEVAPPAPPAPEAMVPAATSSVPADMPAQTMPAPPEPVVPEAMTNAVSPPVPPSAVEMQNAQPTNVSPALNETPVPTPEKKPGFFSRLFHRENRPAVVEEKQVKPTAPNYYGKNNSGFTPITPPPAPVSAEKEAALHALLKKYEADQITPDEYQAQRAEIINSP